MKLWTVGDAVIDLLPQPDMQYKACAGGAPLNVAVGAARLGCDCGFIAESVMTHLAISPANTLFRGSRNAAYTI